MDESIVTSNSCYSLKKRKIQKRSCYLCEDLMAEIIKRLPLRSIIRFRSVSKYWFSRIPSYNFRMLALQSANNPQKVTFRHRIRCIYSNVEVTNTLDPDDHYMGLNSVKFPSEEFKIAGSCNGIIFVTEKKEGGQIVCSLWNPLIRRKLSIPSHPCGSVTFGFGFDPIIDDYKVVAIPLRKCEGIEEKIFIYTVKANSWNVTAFFPTEFSYSRVKSSALLVNGALHWLVDQKILTLNLSTRVFSMYPVPPEYTWILWDKMHLAVFKGSLAVMPFNALRILVRKEYNNVASWSLLERKEDFESYNPEMGVRTRTHCNSCAIRIIEMDMCVESLELLANEACGSLKSGIQGY